MKHLKSIHEEFNRVAGFRYSDPTELYKISVLCIGEDITEDKVIRALNKVHDLKYNEKSVQVEKVEETINTEDGPIEISAIVNFDIIIYTEREIGAILEELANILSSAFDIEIVNHRVKKHYDI